MTPEEHAAQMVRVALRKPDSTPIVGFHLPTYVGDKPLYGPAMDKLGVYLGQLDAMYSEWGIKPDDAHELGDLLDDAIRFLEALQRRWLEDGEALFGEDTTSPRVTAVGERSEPPEQRH